MTPELQNILSGQTREHLKAAIKELIREMAVEAAEGRLLLPDDLKLAEQTVKRRLEELDLLLSRSGSL